MNEPSNVVVNVLEYVALLFLGVLAVLFFMHLLNGTLGSWIDAKIHAKEG